MSKYIQNHIASITIAVLFFIPMAIYFVGNFYWWLWDGNNPNVEKMFAAFVGLLISGYLIAFLQIEVEV